MTARCQDPPCAEAEPFVYCPIKGCGWSEDGQLPTETTLPRMLDPEMKTRLQTCGRKIAQWTAERDRLVREAVEAGGSLREVGLAAGLSHTAVKFIAHGRPKP